MAGAPPRRSRSSRDNGHTRMKRSLHATVLAALLAAAAPAAAQRVTLGEALAVADRSAFANRIAAGGSTAQSAGRIAALRGILPSVRVEGGYVRTTDPIGAFGTTLRQRVITQADFDPARLNYPAATSNYSGGLVVEQPLFNADAFAGRAAAARATAAARASERWTAVGTRVDVVRAYYGAVLADEMVATLETGARAAHEHVRQTEAMARQGVVTRSDALLAAVKAGEVDAQLIEARGRAANARRELAVLLGRPADTVLVAARRLPAGERVRAAVAPDTAPAPMGARADLEAAEAGLAAARMDVLRARSLYLPRINSFARYDWNSPTRLYGGDRNWTVGVMASWTPFAGASEIAEGRATAGREDAARAAADAAEARARLELETSASALAVALAKLDIAERAATQSEEAHRIVTRKYAGGLATVVELLDAAAVERGSRLGLTSAVYATIVAGAERRRALGRDLTPLVSLDDAPDLSTLDRQP